MFGEAAPIMDKDGIEQDVILFGMRQLAADNPEQFGYLAEVSQRELSTSMGRVAFAATNKILGVFGAGMEEPVITPDDALTSVKRGVRPFTIDSDGQNIGIRVILPNGMPSAYLPLDLATTGAAYRAAMQADTISEVAD
jgi:hypothetical protein